jgi:hypothetical protein
VCFRNDKFKQHPETITMRAMNADDERRRALKAWDEEELDLDCIGGIRCVNKKIYLDEDGNGKGCLC